MKSAVRTMIVAAMGAGVCLALAVAWLIWQLGASLTC